MGDWFRFQGRVGRIYFLGALLGGDIFGSLLALLPVAKHKIEFGNGFRGELDYATPLHSGAAESWVVLILYYLGTAAMLWVVIAAAVKRRHDRGKSGKPVGYFFAALATVAVLYNLIPKSGDKVPGADIAVIALVCCVSFAGVFGLFELLLAPGVASPDTDRRLSRPASNIQS